MRPGQSLLWDNDINPEGVAPTYSLGSMFGSAWRYWIEENVPVSATVTSTNDTEMYGLQLGTVSISQSRRRVQHCVHHGHPGRPGRKPASYQLIEKDALFAQHIDSDFGGGLTDADGWVLRTGYAPARNWVLNATYYRNINNKDVGARYDFDRLMLDFNTRF